MYTTTMKRIADELGVSITTVSKVLNHHADISDATRTRVLAKVAELGYSATRSPAASASAARIPSAS
jgi:DNA-binding LacI/PurR family transcriptional regulator